MKLFMGLGNYPQKYKYTYHNIGYCAVDYVAEKLGIRLKRNIGLKIRCGVHDRQYMLAKPQTYMNTSGDIVKKAVARYGVEVEDLVVVCDDLSLDFGQVKMRLKGGSGGHKGLESIIDSLGTKNFARIRVGIGRPGDSSEFRDYVLERLPEDKLQYLDEKLFPLIYETFVLWRDKGKMAAMNYINSFGQ